MGRPLSLTGEVVVEQLNEALMAAGRIEAEMLKTLAKHTDDPIEWAACAGRVLEELRLLRLAVQQIDRIVEENRRRNG